MEAALYGEGGFFAEGGGAGRAGRDFITSPEVGSLFGACVARALDGWWRELGSPDPFLVVEAGAGNGRLARDIRRAEPECLRALRYVLVERSAVLRAEQRTRLALEPADEALGPFVRTTGNDAPIPETNAGPVFASLDDLPALDAVEAVVIANELLDNLVFGIAEFDGARWNEVRVGIDGDVFNEVLVPAADETPEIEVPAGTRAPVPRGIRAWFESCDLVLRRGYVVVIDYMTTATELPNRKWLRTYRGHDRGFDPLVDPGEFDITGDVVVEQLLACAPGSAVRTHTSQGEWLRDLGIDALVEEGAQAWSSGAHRGDLEALAGRSRITEAGALTDPAGLGAHHVVVLSKGARR